MVDDLLPYARSALEQMGGFVDRPDLAAATIAGALLLALNARVALLAPLMILGGGIAQHQAIPVNPFLLEAVPTFAVTALLLGAFQSAITAIAGRDAAASFLGVVLGGLLLFALWRGPARVFRMLSRGRL